MCGNPRLPLPPRSLYVLVITTIRGWGDYLWVDVVEKIDAMGSQVGAAWQAAAPGCPGTRAPPSCRPRCPVWSALPAPVSLLAKLSPSEAFASVLLPQANEFQVQAKKLPKALRDWEAYRDCRRTIDDFLALLPLFQALTHKSIRDRWVCVPDGAGRWG